ncbi:hypothetical protein V5F77_24725 [Xanthobacter sp. DSM 24535]|uniref:hypothetical protein n=1 Tax=Roseixanthobacter psychrophilus TaxID=3119917 RepID=UPI00372C5F8B
MTTASVTHLPSRSRPRRPQVSPTAPRRLRRQQAAAIATGTIAMVLTALSLTHLSAGIHLVTGAAAWECWALGIGIDMGFLAFEGAYLLAATEAVRRQVARYTRPGIIGALTFSAALNALAFWSGAPGGVILQAAAALCGIIVTAMIYLLARTTYVLATAQRV